MIGPNGYSPLDGTPKKIIQFVLQINASTKSMVEFKIYALSVVSIQVSNAHLTKLLSRFRPMPLCVQLQDGTSIDLLTFWELAPCVALVMTWLVSTPPASQPAIELPRVRTRSTKGLRRCKLPARMSSHLSLHSAPSEKRTSVLPSMSRSTLESFSIVCREAVGYHNLAPRRITWAGLCWTNLLTGLQSAGIDQPLSNCVHHCRPGLTLGFLRILCNVLCTAQRFHTEGDEPTCRIGVRMHPTLSLERVPSLV